MFRDIKKLEIQMKSSSSAEKKSSIHNTHNNSEEWKDFEFWEGKIIADEDEIKKALLNFEKKPSRDELEKVVFEIGGEKLEPTLRKVKKVFGKF